MDFKPQETEAWHERVVVMLEQNIDEHRRISTVLEKIDVAIDGNGKPGLKGRLMRVETVIKFIIGIGGVIGVAIIAETVRGMVP